MRFLIILIFAWPVWAEIPLEVTNNIPVYQAPTSDAAVLFNLERGEKIQTTEVANDLYLRIRVKRGAKVRAGFVLKTDALRPREVGELRHWSVGGGGQMTHLSQKSKTFETEDQVSYTTTAYTSQGNSPLLLAQYGQESFWRMGFSVKQTHYKSIASTNIIGTSPMPIQLNQTFYSLLVQHGISPFGLRHFYLGLGAEVAKAMKVQIVLGNNELPATKENKPVYMGAQGFTGGTLFVTDWLSAFAEFRFTLIANQTPMIYQSEVGVGLLFWP